MTASTTISAAARKKRTKLPTVSEHKLQTQVADYLAAVPKPPVYWTAVDHAAKLSPRQAASRKRRGVKRGIADFMIVWKDGYGHTQLIWIELKSARGSLSPEQKDFAFQMIRCNSNVFLCRSVEDVTLALQVARAPGFRAPA